ncbi:hypothetical protein [Dictyobacter formicarum]|uniref:Alpha/beta hydrolase n=1 Tax=Dictyobacter formicarum TaxID=2778368 RepID=A0ABQ3VVN6_9CHLR|nr:hypothetical protein [Dictyobacter formicarum]GHO89850.1 hypothetical protein KSZ_78560 [Dictyobacter formicarum]
MTLSVQTERPITFHSKGQPAFLLEGVVHTPLKAEQAPIVIICHPQPASSDMNDSLNIALPKPGRRRHDRAPFQFSRRRP